MRRVETYIGQQVYEYLFSAQAQYTMTGIAKVCSALFGSNGLVSGLACTPTSPATMALQIGPGEIYQTAPLEATNCGTLPADTAHSILKQGIQLGTNTTATFAAPGTSGQSINYLIEAQYQDLDLSLDPTSLLSPVVLQFYNAATPATPWSGPNDSGATSNNWRDGIVAYQIKAGTAATTGSQVTPSPDTGWIGLWVVTVPFGATTLTSSNIAQYTGAPVLPSGLLQSILTSNLTYGIDGGSANTIQAKFPIPVATPVDGMDVWVKIAAANTGATTFTPNPGVIAAAPVVGAAHAALQGGELVANGRANLIWRQDITSWVLIECTGGALQTAPAVAPGQAVQLQQVTGLVGNARNLRAYLAAAGTSLTITADEVAVKSALGGQSFLLANFNQTVSTVATGIGGVVGTALAANGFAGIYAAFNPTTGAQGAYIANANSPLPNVGAAPPSGWICTGLISVWPLNGSTQFVAGFQQDGALSIVGSTAVTASSVVTNQSTSIATVVPPNAKYISGLLSSTITAIGTAGITLASAAIPIGAVGNTISNTTGGSSNTSSFRDLMLQTAQTVFLTTTASAGGTWVVTAAITSYRIF
ncbi:hypothetical protein [Pararobbsia alpina]|uniref:Uncharacterized protein n=1 Tax=Pararobbsia alpina TaxID=621374 RepID=A0A6S7B3I2_9BURK|nr:hypothetical protein [Pararobbsia alpina]CAB3784263.1 hypothetical protein LMG28138_01774 [Pararobbsia alpina]